MATLSAKTKQPPRKARAGVILAVCLVAVIGGGIVWQTRPRFDATATKALLDASRNRDTIAIQEAIRAGADPNARFSARHAALGTATLWLRSLSPFRPNDALFARRELYSRPHSALTQAVQAGDPEAVSALLNAGANPNLPAGHGWTPLAYAANTSAFLPKKSLAITRLLIAAGANPNLRDADGATPLLVALYSHAPATIIHLLLQSGADTSARMSTGATVSSFLNPKTRPDIVKLFQEREKTASRVKKDG